SISIFIVLLFITSTAVSQNASQIVIWEVETIDLGNVKKGDKAANSYSFINISDQPVEIDIVSTCVCTEAKWTQGKIAPGEKGEINFVFDSSQKDHEEAIDVDVYFLNVETKTERPFSSFLSYTFQFAK
ncbi:MAG: peptidoglycan-associated lipoprotein, partial [Saprospiraceae bacterium]